MQRVRGDRFHFRTVVRPWTSVFDFETLKVRGEAYRASEEQLFDLPEELQKVERSRRCLANSAEERPAFGA